MDPNDRQFDPNQHPLTCGGGGGPHSGVRLMWAIDAWRCPVQGCDHEQGASEVPPSLSVRDLAGIQAERRSPRPEPAELNPVTILDVAIARLRARGDEVGTSISGDQIADVGFPMLGGCCLCHATLGAYNACPSKSGYWKCRSGCIDDDGFETVEDYEAWELAESGKTH